VASALDDTSARAAWAAIDALDATVLEAGHAPAVLRRSDQILAVDGRVEPFGRALRGGTSGCEVLLTSRPTTPDRYPTSARKV